MHGWKYENDNFVYTKLSFWGLEEVLRDLLCSTGPKLEIKWEDNAENSRMWSPGVVQKAPKHCQRGLGDPPKGAKLNGKAARVITLPMFVAVRRCCIHPIIYYGLAILCATGVADLSILFRKIRCLGQGFPESSYARRTQGHPRAPHGRQSGAKMTPR